MTRACGTRGGHARHDLEGNPRGAERSDRDAGIVGGIAERQTYDATAGGGLVHERPADFVSGGALRHLDTLRFAAAHGDHVARHQGVVHDHVGFLQDALRTKREEVDGAGPGAHNPDEAVVGASDSVRSREASRRASCVLPESTASAM